MLVALHMFLGRMNLPQGKKKKKKMQRSRGSRPLCLPPRDILLSLLEGKTPQPDKDLPGPESFSLSHTVRVSELAPEGKEDTGEPFQS